MSIGIVISLLGGLAFFLFGMRTMGEGLERAAGPKLKHFLSLMTRNRFIAMLTGLLVRRGRHSPGSPFTLRFGHTGHCARKA